jgi:hypothetical protein
MTRTSTPSSKRLAGATCKLDFRSEAARVHACQADLKDIRHLPSRAHAVLERFFRATNALEDKELEFLGWRGPKQAAKTVKRLSA